MQIYEVETVEQALGALLDAHEQHCEVAASASDDELAEDYEARFLESGLLDACGRFGVKPCVLG